MTEKTMIAELSEIYSREEIRLQEPMKEYTTFRAGGLAEMMVFPKTNEEIKQTVEICKRWNKDYLVLGRGSNLLIGDGGYEGVVICLRKNLNACTVNKETNELRAQAGVMMPAAAAVALEAGLSGMEFASGIPGTIGGGIRMNAGAYGGEIKQILKEADVLTPEGTVKTLNAEELQLGYRHSCIPENGYLVLSGVFELIPGDTEKIREKMNDFNGRRREKQPLEFGSAGSTFKRPEGYFAGKLIEDAGLKGYRVGDAQVSEKHAGFVINRGNASAKEIMTLCRNVQEKVKEQFGVTLELEVQTAGRFE